MEGGVIESAFLRQRQVRCNLDPVPRRRHRQTMDFIGNRGLFSSTPGSADQRWRTSEAIGWIQRSPGASRRIPPTHRHSLLFFTMLQPTAAPAPGHPRQNAIDHQRTKRSHSTVLRTAPSVLHHPVMTSARVFTVTSGDTGNSDTRRHQDKSSPISASASHTHRSAGLLALRYVLRGFLLSSAPAPGPACG